MESSSTYPSVISLEDLANQAQAIFDNGDEVWKIESLLQDLIAGKMAVRTKDGKVVKLIQEVREAMAENHIFLRYLEDVQLKNQFFEELDNIKERWKCLKERPHKQIYFKRETGNGIISVFYRVRLETNMLKPYALL